MACECLELPDLIDVGAHPTFEAHLEEITLGDWVRLMRCPISGQLWKVDAWDKLQTQFAAKLVAEVDWERVDSTPLRKAFLLQSRGGIDEGRCVKNGCSNRPVKGVAYCLDHLYETGARR